MRERFAKSLLGAVDEAEVASPIDERVPRVLGVGAFDELLLSAVVPPQQRITLAGAAK